ncbi:MAG TPA: diguanylate cyclase [Firmicutes bacterium]|nr:diguanylate cyclase [Bacillota bacterium]
MLVISIFLWNWKQVKVSTVKEAIVSLRMTAERDLAFRTWAARHGGVYVPVSPESPPNPYLAFLEERDVTTTTGQKLTLLNPAYIMRQVNEIGEELTGVCGHLTSLNPVNPVNSADAWETEVLKAFAQNSEIEEITAITDYNGQDSIRLMIPFYTEEHCLKCHGHQGYQIGDVYGAISAVTPLEPYMAIIISRQKSLIPGYALLWLVGFAGLLWFLKRLEFSSESLKANLLRNRAMVQAIPDIIFHYDENGYYRDAEFKNESKLFQIMKDKMQSDTVIGQNISDVLPGEIVAVLLPAIKRATATGEMQLIDYSYSCKNKTLHFEERLVKEGDGEVISIVRDVTEQKEFEANLWYQSFHDSLTGLYNRRFFEAEMATLDVAENLPISIIMGDVNGLKLLNDAFGHAAGDKLLQEAAQILRRSCRSNDIIARWGGDEFVIILPRTSRETAKEIVRRIKALGAQTEIESVRLSISFGYDTKENEDEDLTDVLIAAESYMYQNKIQESLDEACRFVQSVYDAFIKKYPVEDLHACKVAEISKKIASTIGLSDALVQEMEMLGLLHDIGRATINENILTKKGKLTQDEWNAIKRHPEIGFRILNSCKDTAEIAHYVLAHHERYDGTGYPSGLKGEEIPLQARILAVADAFVAMTSNHPFREAQTREYAIAELQKNAGTQFDPQIVKIFLNHVLLESAASS